MNPQDGRPRSLSTAKRIGLLGDTHGDLENLFVVSNTMWERGVSTLVVLGGSGLLWSDDDDGDLDELDRRLGARGQQLYWVCGNRERLSHLYEFPFGEDGLRWVRPSIAHVPRGYRTRLSSGLSFVALDEANFGDSGSRTGGRSRRLQKSDTEQSLDVRGREHVDVLIRDDAPKPLPSEGAQLAESGSLQTEAGNQKPAEGFTPVQRKLYLGGHCHQRRDDHFDYGASGDPSEARIVLLAMTGSTEAISQAVLDLQTFKLDFFRRTDTTVTELTGREEGCWRVTTWGSSHILDLNRWAATRIPGKGAAATINDRERPLLALSACRVGEAGYWTMDSDGWHDPMAHYWHQTSEIQSIERIADTVNNTDRRA